MNKIKCPTCKEVMVEFEKDGRVWYDCPGCGYCFCDDSDYTEADQD